MLTIFNRKELMVTMDFNRQAEMRSLLSEKGIEYVIKTKNLQGSSVAGSRRGHVGSFGIDSNYAYEYKIYVNKNDYEKVKSLVG